MIGTITIETVDGRHVTRLLDDVSREPAKATGCENTGLIMRMPSSINAPCYGLSPLSTAWLAIEAKRRYEASVSAFWSR